VSGNKLVLAAVAALAAAGATRRRGSPKLEELRVDPQTVPQGVRVSTPFKGIMGAARGGPSFARYEQAFARAPFDLRMVLVGSDSLRFSRGPSETLPASLRRELVRGLARPEGTVTFVQALPGLSSQGLTLEEGIARVQEGRKTSRKDAFAIMSPFTVAHRLFDLSYTNSASPLGGVISDSVLMHEEVPDVGDVIEALREQAGDDDDLIDAGALRAQIQEQMSDADEDEIEDVFWQRREELVSEALEETAESVVEACRTLIEADVVRTNSLDFDDPDEIAEVLDLNPIPYMYEDYNELMNRVFASLICPTAAGRKMLLTDLSQAAADCFATWTLSYNPSKERGSIPVRAITADELIRFDAEAWASKWYEANKHKRMVSARKRDAYADTLRSYQPLIRAASALRTYDDEEVASMIARRSKELVRQLPDAMEAAVTLLKAQKVVAG
jgi:hypothetical protein